MPRRLIAAVFFPLSANGRCETRERPHYGFAYLFGSQISLCKFGTSSIRTCNFSPLFSLWN